MSDTEPTIDGSRPVPNAWKRSSLPGVWYVVILATLCVAWGALVWWGCRQDDARKAQAQPAPSHTVIEYSESTGGKEAVKGNTHGPEVSLSGHEVSGDDLNIKSHDFTLVDIGGITGGAFSGSIKASVSGQLWIRLLGLLAFVGCGALAVLSFKKTPLDWHQWGGLGAASLAGLIVAVNPDLFWIGAGGVALAALVNFLPSMTAGKTLDAAQWYDDFTQSDPAITKAWTDFRTKMPANAKAVIDNFIRKTNT